MLEANPLQRVETKGDTLLAVRHHLQSSAVTREIAAGITVQYGPRKRIFVVYCRLQNMRRRAKPSNITPAKP